MSATYTLYVVNEDKLPLNIEHLADQRKYEALEQAIITQGAKWEMLELSPPAFIQALEAIDEELGGTKFLPVLAFNNSPRNVLGGNSAAPALGYFNREQVNDLNTVLTELHPASRQMLESQRLTEKVLNAFESAAAEAFRRGYSLAVVHS
jgi:hypothetical protein